MQPARQLELMQQLASQPGAERRAAGGWQAAGVAAGHSQLCCSWRFAAEPALQHSAAAALASAAAAAAVESLQAALGDGAWMVRNCLPLVAGADRCALPPPACSPVCLQVISSDCRATVGQVSGGGRTEKPMLKAGRAYHKYRVKRNSWPKVRGRGQRG